MEALRYIPAVLLLACAIVLAQRPGDLPLALKGIRRMFGKPLAPDAVKPNPAWRRWLAFLCTLLAFLSCLI